MANNKSSQQKKHIKENLINHFQSKPEIIAVYLFGSLTGDNFSDNSDIDVALMLKDNENLPAFDYRLQVMTELEDILQRDVDVIIFSRADLRLQHQILKGELLIGHNSKERVRRETQSRQEYLDMRYFFDIYEEKLGKGL